MATTIHYTKAHYKYQVKDQVAVVKTDICQEYAINTELVSLSRDGLLKVYPGYAWDGPSGPAIATKSFIRGSLFHDVLYQLMRSESLDRKWKETIDRLLQSVCIDDGMWKIRAWLVYLAVKYFGNASTHPDNKRKIYTAP